MAKRTCQIVGCEQKHRARGLCYNHYTQARIRGDFVTQPHALRWANPLERFMAKVDQNGPNGCWVWTAAKDREGYGRFGVANNGVLAHRAGYEMMVGPIPDGLQIDHLCRNTSCVNPRHLEPVTPKVNVHRSFNVAALNVRKTHCIHGHEFTPENTAYIKLGRACRTCRRLRSAAAKAAKKTTLTTRRAT